MYQKRIYRDLVSANNLVPFKVIVNETDLFIHAKKQLDDLTRKLVLRYRGYIEKYIQRFPDFANTLKPWRVNGPAPMIITKMAKAGAKAGVGPMAAVAGAIAEKVGIGLLSYTEEVVVENGGDVFIKTDGPITIGIFAGQSSLSLRCGLHVSSPDKPVSVCTSSGTVGHSLSFGKADAVCVVAESCFLADAAATAIGNRVMSKADIQRAIDFGENIEGVTGLVVIIDEEIGFWGDLELVPLQ